MTQQTLLAGDIARAGGKQGWGVAFYTPAGELLAIGAVPPGGGSGPYIASLLPEPGRVLAVQAGGFVGAQLRRYLVNGESDPAFTPPGDLHSVQEVIAHGSGYLLRGTFTTIGGVARQYFARLNEDGTLDTGWSASPAGDGLMVAMAAHQGGAIVVRSDTGGGHLLSRIAPDGTLDAGFAVRTFTGGVVRNIFVQPDGKVVVVGLFTTVDGPVPVAKITRLNADGTLDAGWAGPTFDAHWTDYTPDEVKCDSTGALYVRLTNPSLGGRNVLKKLASDGSSIAWTHSGLTVANEFIVTADDGVVAWTSDGTTFRNLLKWDAAGAAVDAWFDNADRLAAATTSARIAKLPDGSVVTGGSTTSTVGGVTLTGVFRKTAAGAVDPAFQGGLNKLPVRDVVALPDGTVAVCGDFTGAGTVVATRLALIDHHGRAPAWFSPSLYINIASTAQPYCVREHGGLFYIGGFFSGVHGPSASAPMASLARLLPNGNPDPAFANPTAMNGTTTPATVNDLLVEPDGKIVVIGWINRIGEIEHVRQHTARFNPDGTPDSPFNPPAINDTGYCLARQPDGKLLIGGSFTTLDGVAMRGVGRLNADGTVDGSWTNPAINVSSTSRYVKQMVLQPDGKLLIAGSFTNVGGLSSPGVMRLNADGSRDTGFTPAITGPTECVALAPDGSVFIGGNAAVAKMNPDGTPAVWSNPFGTGDVVRAIALEADGSLIVSGEFNRAGYRSFARLLPSGDIDTAYPATPIFGSSITQVGVVTAMARFDTPAIGARVSARSLGDFVGRQAFVDYAIYGGVPPYALSIDGRAPDGLTATDTGVAGVLTRAGRYRWSLRITDSEGGELLFKTDSRVHPLELPYGALLVETATATVSRVDWQGGNRTALILANNSLRYGQRLRNGKIVVTGNFTSFDGGTRRNLALLNADGTRDTSFVGPPASTVLGDVKGVDVDSAGRLVVVSTANEQTGGSVTRTGYVIRLVADGSSLDATFTVDSDVVLSTAMAVKVLPDDRILVSGAGRNFTMERGEPILFRLNADGSLDDAFLAAFPQESGGSTSAQRFNSTLHGIWGWSGTGGLINAGSEPSVRSVNDFAFDRDGNIVLVGGFNNRKFNIGTPALRVDVALPHGGHADPINAELQGTPPSYYATASVYKVFANADGSYTCIGSFTRKRLTDLATGFATLDRSGALVAAATDLAGPTAPLLDYATKLNDGRYYATFSRQAGKAVRLFPDGSVDTSFVSPAQTVVAIIPDDNGASNGFSASGLVGVAVHATIATVAEPFVAHGAIAFVSPQGGSEVDTAVVRESIVLGSAPTPLPVSVSIDRLSVGGAPAHAFDGAAAVLDAVAFADDPTWVVFKLVEDTVVLGADGAPTFTALVRVVEHLLLAGRASHLAEAVGHVTDALVLRTLGDAFQVGVAADTLLLGDHVASVYSQIAAVVERVLFEAGAAPSYTAMVVVRDAVVLSGRGAPTELELVALVRDAIGFAANLTIDNGEYVAWVMNTESKGLSRYTQYPFNSFARIGGRYVGCAADGLHWLDGDTDNGAEIRARIRLGMSAMGSRRLKRIPEAFVGYTSDGVLLLKAIVTDEDTGDRNAAIFRLRPRPATSLRENRFTLGRGLKAVDWDFEIENVDGADFALHAVEFRPLLLERRTRG